MRDNFNVSVKKRKVKIYDLSGGLNGSVDGTNNERYPAVTNNFQLSTGALIDGVGIERLQIKIGSEVVIPNMPQGVDAICGYFYKRYNSTTHLNDDRLIILGDDHKMYECKLFDESLTMTAITGLTFTTPPKSALYKLNGVDVIMFSTNGTLYVYNGSSVSTYTAPAITSMCVHNERLFVTGGEEGKSLWFSETFDPTNWNVSLSEAGFIDFEDGRGKLLKAISFCGYVFVFRSYGITRLSAYGDQTTFDLDNLFVSSGRIIQNSITECGKYVVYLSKEGFYRFDGSYAVRIMKGLDKYLSGVDNSDMTGIYYGGKFYASIKVNINGKTENTLLCYDFTENAYYICKGIYAIGLVDIKGDEYDTLCVLTQNSGLLGMISKLSKKFDKPLEKVWSSNVLDFGLPNEIKTLSKISLYSKGKMTIKVESDYGKVESKINGSEYEQSVFIGLKGNGFKIAFISNEIDANISKISIMVERG